MNKDNINKTPHLNVLKQYIKDLSYENFQRVDTEKTNTKENDTKIEINVAFKAYDDNHFETIIKVTVNSKSKKENYNVFCFELEYLGFFKLANVKNYNKDDLSSEAANMIFPAAQSIITSITKNGGNIAINLDDLDFHKLKS